MKPKEKAIELVEKFKKQTFGADDFRKRNAKKCALICVIEIMNTVYGEWDDYMNEPKQEYWQEVKTELNKL